MEKAVAPHSSTLAWKIPWTEEPGRLKSMRLLRAGHDWATSLSLFTFMPWRRKWQPTPVFLPGESQGWGSRWAAVYGVAQNRTRLKQISSGSPSSFLVHPTGLCWDHGGDLWLRGPKTSFRWFAQTHSHCRADRAPVLCDPQLGVPRAPFSMSESRENTDVGCSPSQMATCLCDP